MPARMAGKSKGRARMATKKPNILVLWGDDIGQSNLSAYTMGLMGYRTPNIDSIAKQGMIFTDYYAEASCTAGRAASVRSTRTASARNTTAASAHAQSHRRRAARNAH